MDSREITAKPDDSIVKTLAVALEEDIGTSDITTDSTVPEELLLKGILFSKEEGIIGGLHVVDLFFERFYNAVLRKFFVEDGQAVKKGDKVLELRGPGRMLLSTERLVLNILQRMSGIATETHRFVESVTGTNAKILDTRKTAPGLRLLDKLAVRLGGGTNHRQGLFDAYLIKENHIAAAGGLAEAVSRVVKSNSDGKIVEVEVRSIEELKEALDLRIDRILLDNMAIDEMKKAVEVVAGRVPLEASGNVTLKNVRQIAETGVDFISVGSLTHSVRALDLSFLIEKG
jgi:nicotinate-nucleotide pyrophosphorylase (carboxylating)